jgi:FkbM family methyltransferase
MALRPRFSVGRGTTMWSMLEFFPEDFTINILDVGAALLEDPPYKALVDSGRASVIGFEPNQEECDKLNATYGGTHRFYPYFIGDGKPATFYETNWAPTGSLYEPNFQVMEKFQNLAELTRVVATHSVNTIRLDDIAGIGDIDFIKIDVQGSELSVFQNAASVLSDVVLIQTEVEFIEQYVGQPMFADVDIFLRQNGFQFHTFDYFGRRAFKPLIFNDNASTGLRQDIWADAIYVRDWLHLEDIDAVKLKKYAVLAHDLVKSFDLAHVILSALDRKTGSSTAAAYIAKFIGQQFIY